MPIVEMLKRVRGRKSATPAQIALAWLLAQKPLIVPIPGTRNTDHLNENLGALHVQLTPADLRDIQTAFATGEGSRRAYERSADGAGRPNGLTIAAVLRAVYSKLLVGWIKLQAAV